MSTLPRILLYQFQQPGKDFFRYWVEKERLKGQISYQFLDNIRQIPDNTDKPGGKNVKNIYDKKEPTILILPKKMHFSREMRGCWAANGIYLIYTIEYFTRNFQPSFFISDGAPVKKILFIDSKNTHITLLRNILLLFNLDIFNKALSKRNKLSSWQEIPDIKNYDFNKWGPRPLLILNLDFPALSLKPFLRSLNTSFRLKKNTEEFLVRPQLLPIKDFSQGLLWDEITSGIRCFSKAILSISELITLIIDVMMQKELRRLKSLHFDLQQFDFVDNIINGSLTDTLTNPQLYSIIPQFTKHNKLQLEKLEKLGHQYSRLFFLREGLDWFWESSDLKNILNVDCELMSGL